MIWLPKNCVRISHSTKLRRLNTFKIAIAQLALAFLNRDAEITAVVHTVAIAAVAKLLVFPEAIILGYLVWIRRLRPGTNHAQSDALHSSLVDQACSFNSE